VFVGPPPPEGLVACPADDTFALAPMAELLRSRRAGRLGATRVQRGAELVDGAWQPFTVELAEWQPLDAHEARRPGLADTRPPSGRQHLQGER
jgi:hypothetical protein